MKNKNKKCSLCKAEKRTKWFHNDHTCWIAECMNSNKIIVVYNHHSEPSRREEQHMWAMTQILFPNKRWEGRKQHKKCHWHEYII